MKQFKPDDLEAFEAACKVVSSVGSVSHPQQYGNLVPFWDGMGQAVIYDPHGSRPELERFSEYEPEERSEYKWKLE